MIEDIFHNWTPREIAAMHRATSKLRDMQPTEMPPSPKTGVRGCYYNQNQAAYLIHTYINSKRIYCGRLKDWDKEKAQKMQREMNSSYKRRDTI